MDGRITADSIVSDLYVPPFIFIGVFIRNSGAEENTPEIVRGHCSNTGHAGGFETSTAYSLKHRVDKK